MNEVKLGSNGHPISEELSTVTVGGERTSLEISRPGGGARINGGLEVTGDIKGNIVSTDLLIDDIVCDDLQANGSTVNLQNLEYTKDGADQVITGKTGVAGDLADIKIETELMEIHLGDVLQIWAEGGDFQAFTLDPTSRTFYLYFVPGGHFKIQITDSATTITTVGTGGAEGDLTFSIDGFIDMNSASGEDITLDSGGDIILDSNDGNFIAKKAGTEFSAANSAYAGMILGYTRISNDSTTSGHANIEPTGTMTVLRTAQGTDVSVTFTAPPSGNVEISMLCNVYASSRTLEFALSSAVSFAEVDETHTYDSGAQSSDKSDINMTYISFVNTGLTAGTEYTRWIACAETFSGTSIIRHGRNRTGGTHYPPIIVKAIALPATIVTGE